jgi:hypothetical protein
LTFFEVVLALRDKEDFELVDGVTGFLVAGGVL